MATEGKVITCKAAIAWEKNIPMVIEDVQVAPPGPKEVRIKIVASGLCHSDVHAHVGEMFPTFPIILGHEGAGIVESIGEGVTTVKPGDKVLTFVLPNCFECRNCKLDTKLARPCQMFLKDGEPRYKTMDDGTTRFTCRGKSIYHFGGNSTFAEYTVCPEISIGKINDDAPLENACLYACGFPTGYGAARNIANVFPGANVAVWGLGGVGLCAVLGAKKAGAKTIIGVDTNPGKYELAKKTGCTDCLNPLDSNFAEVLNEKTGGGNLDHAIVCVGSLPAIQGAITAASVSGGTVVVVGISGDNLTIPANIFLSGIKIDGCTLGGYSLRKDVPPMVDEYMRGEFETDHLITHTFKLDQINEAFKCLINGECLRSRIVM